MSIKDVISNHPHFESCLIAARGFLSNDLLRKFADRNTSSLEDVLVRELLHINDHSAGGMGATNISKYLNGEFDRNGLIVNRGAEGLIEYLMAVRDGTVTPPKAGLCPMPQLGNLYQLFNNWPHRQMHDLDAQKIIHAGRLIAKIANAAGIALTVQQVGTFSVKVIQEGALTEDDVVNAFDRIMRAEHPNEIHLPYNRNEEFVRVKDEVNKLLSMNQLYRLPFQIDMYVSRILGKTMAYDDLDEAAIFRLLSVILGLEQKNCRGTFVVGDGATPISPAIKAIIEDMKQRELTPEEMLLAKDIRNLLARQGESWSLKDIDAYAIEVHRETKEAGVTLTTEMLKDAVAQRNAIRNAVQKPVRNIADVEMRLTSSLKIAAEEQLSIYNGDNPANQEPVLAYNNGDYYGFYRNDVLHVITREYGLSPVGNPLVGAWVLRKLYTGEYIDHDHNRNDLAERHAIKLRS